MTPDRLLPEIDRRVRIIVDNPDVTPSILIECEAQLGGLVSCLNVATDISPHLLASIKADAQKMIELIKNIDSAEGIKVYKGNCIIFLTEVHNRVFQSLDPEKTGN